MLSRRDFLAVAAATAAVTGLGDRLAGAAARQRLSQQDLLTFSPKGQVTILHMTDCHAQLVPAYYREPSVNLGVGDAAGKPPHVTGSDFLKLFDIAPGSARAYALTSEDFAALAKDYGRVGGHRQGGDRWSRRSAPSAAPTARSCSTPATRWHGSYTAASSPRPDRTWSTR